MQQGNRCDCPRRKIQEACSGSSGRSRPLHGRDSPWITRVLVKGCMISCDAIARMASGPNPNKFHGALSRIPHTAWQGLAMDSRSCCERVLDFQQGNRADYPWREFQHAFSESSGRSRPLRGRVWPWISEAPVKGHWISRKAMRWHEVGVRWHEVGRSSVRPIVVVAGGGSTGLPPIGLPANSFGGRPIGRPADCSAALLVARPIVPAAGTVRKTQPADDNS